MQHAPERMALITELITLSRPLDDILRDLARHSGDPDAELANVERGHVVSMLERYLSGELDEATVEEWADAIELRDDIGLAENDKLLQQALFDLANPPVAEPLTAPRAKTLISMLRDR